MAPQRTTKQYFYLGDRLPVSRATAVEFSLIIKDVRQLFADVQALQDIIGNSLDDGHREALELQLGNLQSAARALEARFGSIGLENAYLPPASASASLRRADATTVSTLELMDTIADRLAETRIRTRAVVSIATDLEGMEEVGGSGRDFNTTSTTTFHLFDQRHHLLRSSSQLN